MRWQVLAGYVVLIAALLVEPLWDPFEQGDDDSWVFLAVFALAHLGLGAGLRTSWALLIAASAVLVLFLTVGASGDDVLVLVFGTPVAVVCTLIGWGVGRSPATGPVLLGAAGLFVAWAGVVAVQRASADRLPASAQDRLPIELSLGNLCPGASTPGDVRRDLRRRTDALIEELDRRPGALVRYTYHWSHEPAEERWITVRELAEEQREQVECAPAIHRRLDAALSG